MYVTQPEHAHTHWSSHALLCALLCLLDDSQALRTKGVADYMEVIAKARVPIIKFREAETGINVDICFDQESASESVTQITDMIDTYPVIRPLMLVLKYFLLQRAQHETYHGGVGSFMLLCMLQFVVLQRARDMAIALQEANKKSKNRKKRGANTPVMCPCMHARHVRLVWPSAT